MPDSPTYYEILGLASTASQADIKKRYRELARRYHPDVSKTPDAARRFTEINEANSVLSDVDKRANYDARLKLAGYHAANRNGTAEGQRAEGRGKSNTQHPTPGSSRPTPNAQRPTPNASSGASRPAARPNPADALVVEAQKAFSRLKYREAEALCRQANRHRRTSTAYEILGDIYRIRNRIDDAVAMYSYAIQLDRSNRHVQEKFDRLTGQTSGPKMAGNASRAARSAGPVRSSSASVRTSESGSPQRVVVSVLGIFLLLFLLGFVAREHTAAPTSAWLVDWDGKLLFALAAAGLVSGALFAINGILNDAAIELFSARTSRGGTVAVPIGALIFGFSLLFFYAAFLIYLGLAVVQDILSKHILLAFVCSFLLVILFAVLIPGAGGLAYILLCGGNILLPAFILGWGAGSRFRRQI
jgi:curved DNA-binding protein CbpA